MLSTKWYNFTPLIQGIHLNEDKQCTFNMSSNSTIVLNSNEVLDQMGKETLKEPRLDDFDYPHHI